MHVYGGALVWYNAMVSCDMVRGWLHVMERDAVASTVCQFQIFVLCNNLSLQFVNLSILFADLKLQFAYLSLHIEDLSLQFAYLGL